MSIDSIIWDLDDDPNGNVQHCAEHDVSKEEIEEVFKNILDRTSVIRPVGQLSLETRVQADI